jgi:hypothetical protein
MAKATSRKRTKLSVPLPPSPTKVEFIGPYDEAYCFLYRALGRGFFNYEFKPQTVVTEQEWNDPSITIYKMAALHHAVVRHQKLDHGKGSLEIFQAPYIAPVDGGVGGSIGEPIILRRCVGDCPEYEIDDCLLTEDPVCIEGELRCRAHVIPPGSQKAPAGKKGKSSKDRPAAN